MHVRYFVRSLGLLLAAATSSAAQGRTKSTDSVTWSASARTRAESWNWFGDTDGDRYTFLGSIVRGALAQQLPRWSWRAELAAPILLGLPEDAVEPPPRGQLGLGAAYWAANDSARNDAHVFLKQAFVRLGRPASAGGLAVKLGRFEFNDGLETTPADTTVAALKRDRVSQRLIGTFGWSHVGRSFDGAHATWDRAGRNGTLLVARPTAGAFDVNGWPGLDVVLLYGSYTLPVVTKRLAGDGRVFVAHYADSRDDATVVKVDNRPVAARTADREAIGVTTVGAHWVESGFTVIGKMDAVLWGALQFGEWGTQPHGSGAAAFELGWQPGGVPSLRPWIRAGWYRASGDADAADDEHSTFFSMLPTPRVYARTPFYTLMNVEDIFASLILRPRPSLTTRLDVRQIRLANGADLWYAGGGAFEESTFGYAGRPANGLRQLASLVDLSVDWRVSPRWSLTAYGALADGGIVAEAIYPESPRLRFGYLELQYAR